MVHCAHKRGLLVDCFDQVQVYIIMFIIMYFACLSQLNSAAQRQLGNLENEQPFNKVARSEVYRTYAYEC